MIVSDAIVIIVTWIKTWSTIQIARKLRVRMSFMSLVLKEGIVYFWWAQSRRRRKVHADDPLRQYRVVVEYCANRLRFR